MPAGRGAITVRHVRPASDAMPALPQVIGQDDIAQALMTEVLAAAAEGPTTPARWTRNRLITRARSNDVGRAVAR
jgi:hypothetical protein